MEMWSARLTSSANCSDFLPNPDSRLTETDLYWRESPPPRTSQRNRLLDEQQRRLYAGLESLKLGRGGDRQLADFLDLDSHTVARGRYQLLSQDVEVDRARKAGAGRKRVEKQRPK